MYRWCERLAAWLAIAGGLILCAIALMTVASVTGRAFVWAGLGPIPGDFELVELGVAVAVFFFLPWCHLRDGHATVDLLYTRLPVLVQRRLVLVSEWLMLAVWVLLTWRLGHGLADKFGDRETTFILQLPVWWAYALCFAAAVLGCLVYLAKALHETRGGAVVMTTGGGQA
ncbi:MAG: TRAP transporter small permease [Casimicrobiaceae bacterium]